MACQLATIYTSPAERERSVREADRVRVARAVPSPAALRAATSPAERERWTGAYA